MSTTVFSATVLFLRLVGPQGARMAACFPQGLRQLDAPLATAAASHMGQDGRLVIFHSGWQDWLVMAMAAGTPPQAALAEWCALTEDLLAVHRRNRRRILLVDGRLLWLQDAGAQAALADWAGTGLQGPALDAPTAATPLQMVLALQTFARAPEAAGIALAFEAAALPMPALEAAPDLADAAFAQLCRLQAGDQEREALNLALAKAQGERDTLSAAVAEAHIEQGRLQDRLRETDTAQAEADARLAAMTQDLEQTKAARILMAENMGLGQAELERRVAAGQTSEAQIAALEAERDRLQQALDAQDAQGRATLEHQIVTLRKAAEAEKSALERELVQAVRRMDRLSDNRQALALAQATIQRMTGEIRQLVDQQTRSAPPPQDGPAAQG